MKPGVAAGAHKHRGRFSACRVVRPRGQILLQENATFVKDTDHRRAN